MIGPCIGVFLPIRWPKMGMTFLVTSGRNRYRCGFTQANSKQASVPLSGTGDVGIRRVWRWNFCVFILSFRLSPSLDPN